MTLHLSPEELMARHRMQQKLWRANHPEAVKEYHRKYHAKPEIQERRTAWQRDNKEKRNARRRELYQLKKETVMDGTSTESHDATSCI